MGRWPKVEKKNREEPPPPLPASCREGRLVPVEEKCKETAPPSGAVRPVARKPTAPPPVTGDHRILSWWIQGPWVLREPHLAESAGVTSGPLLAVREEERLY